MKKIIKIIILLELLIQLSVNAQTNLITNGNFENGWAFSTNNCQYSSQQNFTFALYENGGSWSFASSCGCGNETDIAPFWITPECYSYYQYTYNSNSSYRPAFYGVVDESFIPGKLVYLYVNQNGQGNCHMAIRNSLNAALIPEETYILKIKALGFLQNNSAIPSSSYLHISFSKFGSNWDCDNCGNQKWSDVANIVIFPADGWKQYIFEITVPSGFDELTNIILYEERSGMFIDDVELYQKDDYYCKEDVLIQNKSYDGWFYNTDIQDLPFLTSAQSHIYAGYDVDENQANGHVFIKEGATITYEAGGEIFLENGFEVEQGAFFEAYIGDNSCSNRAKTSGNQSGNFSSSNSKSQKSIIKGNEKEFEISIAPNPSNGVFSIQYSNDILDNASLQVFSMLGNLVYKQNLKNELNQEIDLNSLAEGMYYIQIQNKDKSFSKKIVLQR